MKKLLGNKITKAIALVAVVAVVGAGYLFSVSAVPDVKEPVASGVTVLSNSKAEIDASNTSEGYIMVKYTGGSTGKIKAIVNKSGGESYVYNLGQKGVYETLPLTQGNGSYKITVYEGIGGTKYTTAYGTSVTVSLSDENVPFLYPNQYVNFNKNSKTVAVGKEVVQGAATELDKVSAVYAYVVNNFTYDYEKAKTVQSGYLPKVDEIVSSGKGICFDYASVMATMLRSQGIPTKLMVGYVGDAYHAWISVYIHEVGWVENIIYFDGTDWRMMDPTFASSSSSKTSFKPEENKYSAKFAY